MSEPEVIWEQEGVQVLRRECEEPDSFRYEYNATWGLVPFSANWTQNPQEFGVAGRSMLRTDTAKSEFTMFLKNERYFNHYGVRL